MSVLKLDCSFAKKFVAEHTYHSELENAKKAYETLHGRKGLGNDFLGWIDLPTDYDKTEFQRIKNSAEKIKQDSDVLVVIGIGGSYLGARAVIEALGGELFNLKAKNDRKAPEILFAGNSISSTYLHELCEYLKDKNFSINVISKSGTTTEPALAFRVLKKLLESKYSAGDAAKRIYATTDKSKGALKKLATESGYETFVVPDDVGGRFSFLTAVGLLPIAAAGFDIEALMTGARDASKHYKKNSEDNDSIKYAVFRNALYRQGRSVEILVNYETRLNYVSEWWKQLFGESEGKDGKGLLPASVSFSTDLHSLGQYIQSGERILFETVLQVKQPKFDLTVDEISGDIDGLNYLKGKTVDFINKNACKGTLIAHNDGDVPNIVLEMDKIAEYELGYTMYFFEHACGISGYMLGVNPFDQPGVEAYKNNMFALLGKQGYEELRKKLENHK